MLLQSFAGMPNQPSTCHKCPLPGSAVIAKTVSVPSLHTVRLIRSCAVAEETRAAASPMTESVQLSVQRGITPPCRDVYFAGAANGALEFQMSVAIRHAPSGCRRTIHRYLPGSLIGAAAPGNVKLS